MSGEVWCDFEVMSVLLTVAVVLCQSCRSSSVVLAESSGRRRSTKNKVNINRSEMFWYGNARMWPCEYQKSNVTAYGFFFCLTF